MKIKGALLITLLTFIASTFYNCTKEKLQNSVPLEAKIVYTSFVADSSHNYSADTFYYDIDKDGENDIRVSRYMSHDSTERYYGGNIHSITGEIQFCEINNNPWDLLHPGDEVKENMFTCPNDRLYSGTMPYFPASTFWFKGCYVEYIGVYALIGEKKYFGWLRLDNLRIIEMAISQSDNYPTLIGQKE